ncbi:MAG TPA: DUF456 domain-containing protein, partial [Oceanipulchritudo sp.]|nr:DUF456 domain-containing protein [Oceanipulchritudo sp.]
SSLIALGLLGTLLPILPGTVFAFAGILMHKLLLGETSVSWEFVAIAFGITLLTLIIDAWCSWWGARRFGASWKGALGAVSGGLLGLIFFNLPGLILGPIAGAVIFELLDSRSGPDAARAGAGTVVGALLAFILKVGLTTGMAAGFYLALVLS